MNATQYLIDQKSISSIEKASFIDDIINGINGNVNLNDLQEKFVKGILDWADYFLASQNPKEVIIITLNLATYINSCHD